MTTRSIPTIVLVGALTLGSTGLGATHTPRADSAADSRIAELDRNLESTHTQIASPHFLVRYPKEVSEEYARGLASLLETELGRLQVWIPYEPAWPLEIVMFPAEEFEKAYGLTVSGMYDGRIRVPVESYDGGPDVLTSALTHELVHALVTEYTDYGAPPWLHEGLAQYLESDYRMPDPLRSRKAEGLPLPLVDEILLGAAEPGLVERAYRESAWAAHFLGSRFGISGIRRLLGAYADGKDPETALQDALGLSTLELERKLAAWRLGVAPRVYEASLAAMDDDAEPRRAPGGWTRRMNVWHRHYVEQVEPVKASLRRIVDALDGEGTVPLDESCPRLLDELTVIFGSSEFACPLDEARQVLFEAFRHIEEVGLACELGHTEQMTAKLQAAEESLRHAASILEPYGLRP